MARSPLRRAAEYMYSTLIPLRRSAWRVSRSPPGRSGTSTATTRVLSTVKPASFSTARVRSASSTMRRRMPNSAMSASGEGLDVDPVPREHVHHVGEAARAVLQEQRDLRDFHAVAPFARRRPAGARPLGARRFRLSMTRFALPSLRASVRGSTSVTFARMPMTWSMACLELLLQPLERADLVAEDLRRHLDLHLDLVEPLLAGEDDLVVRQRPLDLRAAPPRSATGRRSRRG